MYISGSPAVIRLNFSWLLNRSHTKKKSKSLNKKIRETCKKRCISERTSKTEITPEDQSEKAESCWENLWNEIQLKGP